MTKYTIKSTTLKTALIASLLGIGSLAASTSSAIAMTLHNCTQKSQYVRLRGQKTNSIQYSNTNLKPGATVFPDLGRGQKYKMLLGAGSSRKGYSGWRAKEELSLRTIGGNTEISRGNFCPKRPDPIKDDNDIGGGSGGCLKIGDLRICKD